MLNLNNKNRKITNADNQIETDPFAARLNSPFYKFFDYLAQYLILNLAMAAVSILSFHLLDYFSFNACSRLFLLEKEEQESISWGKYYFQELKKNLSNKRMHIENFFHLLLLLTVIFCIVILLDGVGEIAGFIISLTAIVSFLLFFSQRLWAGPLRNLYEQETVRRNFLLFSIFFLQKFLYSALLFALQLLLMYMFTVIPALTLLFYAPIIPFTACFFVRRFAGKMRK